MLGISTLFLLTVKKRVSEMLSYTNKLVWLHGFVVKWFDNSSQNFVI